MVDCVDHGKIKVPVLKDKKLYCPKCSKELIYSGEDYKVINNLIGLGELF